jgi:predicted RNA-binding Zn-ribbon protein involved in translation (DUF1610 family)
MIYVDVKYIGLISCRLQKFSKKKENLYNFRCPYCGDSQKNKNRTRAYFYQRKSDFNFKCHNCGISKSFTYFLKDLDSQIYDEYILERYREGLSGKGTVCPEPEFKFKKPVFGASKPVNKLNIPTIADLDKLHPARVYLENRKIPEKFYSKLYYAEKFKEWTNTQKHTFNSIEKDESRIIIPLINHGEIFGYQGRSLNKDSNVKYITIILNDKHPKIFGLDNLNYEKPVYIVEGPFDSMFLNNSIAMVGADFDKMFFISNFNVDFVMVYDNEKRNKEIVNRIETAIDYKFPVVIWPNDLKEKDINDMILAGKCPEKIISENTFSGLEAKTKLIGWKRV